MVITLWSFLIFPQEFFKFFSRAQVTNESRTKKIEKSIQDPIKHLQWNFFSENSKHFLAVYYLWKTTPSQMFDKVLNALLKGTSKMYQLCSQVQERHHLISSCFRMCLLWTNIKVISLCEKCLKTEIFLVRIFLYSDWIQKNTDQKKTR